MSLKSKIVYQLANFFLQNNFFNEISNFFKNKNSLVIFDVGCYEGDFSEKILKLLMVKNLCYTMMKNLNLSELDLENYFIEIVLLNY